jgi:RNA polymerase sigma-70 factor (ECF subfamily)
MMDSGPAANIDAFNRSADDGSVGGSARAGDDARLMMRYREGDLAAFEALYARHKGALYRYLQRISHSREAANDLFQEVWSRVIASRASYEPRAQFTTFLYRIAHNCAVDHFRRAARHRESQMQDVQDIEDEIATSDPRPDDVLSHAQLQAQLREALDRLPAEQREVFVLYEESGLSLDDIGRVTGVEMETAKSRLRYAINKLRSALRLYRLEEQA